MVGRLNHEPKPRKTMSTTSCGKRLLNKLLNQARLLSKIATWKYYIRNRCWIKINMRFKKRTITRVFRRNGHVMAVFFVVVAVIGNST